MGTGRVGPNLGWVVSRFVSAYITCSRKAGLAGRRGGVFNIYNLSALYLTSCLGIVVLRFLLVVSSVLCCFLLFSRGERDGAERERVWICILCFFGPAHAHWVGECNGQVVVLGQQVVRVRH